MKVAYHFPITPEGGRALSYEAAVDSTIGQEDLNDMLDTMRVAAERQKAIHDLPFHKMRLGQNRAKLPAREKELALMVATAQAKAVATAQAKANRNAAGRRNQLDVNPADQLDVNPADQQNIAKLESALADLVATIEADELEIPRLEAIIAGQKPPVELSAIAAE